MSSTSSWQKFKILFWKHWTLTKRRNIWLKLLTSKVLFLTIVILVQKLLIEFFCEWKIDKMLQNLGEDKLKHMGLASEEQKRDYIERKKNQMFTSMMFKLFSSFILMSTMSLGIIVNQDWSQEISAKLSSSLEIYGISRRMNFFSSLVYWVGLWGSLLSAVLVASIYLITPLFAGSNPLLIWLFFLLHYAHLVSLGIIVAVIFVRPGSWRTDNSTGFMFLISIFGAMGGPLLVDNLIKPCWDYDPVDVVQNLLKENFTSFGQDIHLDYKNEGGKYYLDYKQEGDTKSKAFQFRMDREREFHTHLARDLNISASSKISNWSFVVKPEDVPHYQTDEFGVVLDWENRTFPYTSGYNQEDNLTYGAKMFEMPTEVWNNQADKGMSIMWTVLFGIFIPYSPLSYFIKLICLGGKPFSLLNFQLTFENLMNQPNLFSYIGLFGMMFFNVVVCYLVAYFLDASSNGPKKDKGTVPKDAAIEDKTSSTEIAVIQNNAIEDGTLVASDSITTNEKPPLELKHLSKYFGTKVANSNLNLKVHNGEIFGLLGHNGAGKTTLVNMLTGQIRPSKGDAYVCGRSIKSDLTGVRHLMSVCPQDSPMWPEFTVREHLYFFAICRGDSVVPVGAGPSAEIANFDQDKINGVIEGIIKSLNLSDKLDAKCGNLSGGQKRRLWVATSLLGKSTKLLLMDEPTSGMDPEARRDFWRLLKNIVRKERKSVVFSTHYLEEADLLADRKVVLSHGRVKALGTSQELKKQFGTGYWMNVVYNKEVSHDPQLLATKKQELLNMSEKVLHPHNHNYLSDPSLRLASRHRHTNPRFFSVSIPWDRVQNLPILLDEVQQWQEELALEQYSLEMTSLDEVFCAIGENESLMRNRKNAMMLTNGPVNEANGPATGGANGGLVDNLNPTSVTTAKKVIDVLKPRIYSSFNQVYAIFIACLQEFLRLPPVTYVTFIFVLLFFFWFQSLNFSSVRGTLQESTSDSGQTAQHLRDLTSFSDFVYRAVKIVDDRCYSENWDLVEYRNRFLKARLEDRKKNWEKNGGTKLEETENTKDFLHNFQIANGAPIAQHLAYYFNSYQGSKQQKDDEEYNKKHSEDPNKYPRSDWPKKYDTLELYKKERQDKEKSGFKDYYKRHHINYYHQHDLSVFYQNTPEQLSNNNWKNPDFNPLTNPPPQSPEDACKPGSAFRIAYIFDYMAGQSRLPGPQKTVMHEHFLSSFWSDRLSSAVQGLEFTLMIPFSVRVGQHFKTEAQRGWKKLLELHGLRSYNRMIGTVSWFIIEIMMFFSIVWLMICHHFLPFIEILPWRTNSSENKNVSGYGTAAAMYLWIVFVLCTVGGIFFQLCTSGLGKKGIPDLSSPIQLFTMIATLGLHFGVDAINNQVGWESHVTTLFQYSQDAFTEIGLKALKSDEVVNNKGDMIVHLIYCFFSLFFPLIMPVILLKTAQKKVYEKTLLRDGFLTNYLIHYSTRQENSMKEGDKSILKSAEQVDMFATMSYTTGAKGAKPSEKFLDHPKSLDQVPDAITLIFTEFMDIYFFLALTSIAIYYIIHAYLIERYGPGIGCINRKVISKIRAPMKASEQFPEKNRDQNQGKSKDQQVLNEEQEVNMMMMKEVGRDNGKINVRSSTMSAVSESANAEGSDVENTTTPVPDAKYNSVISQNLRHRFQQKRPDGSKIDFWALNGISIGIKKGETLGLLGPNGAGKTTTLSLIIGNEEDKLGAPTSGRVVYNIEGLNKNNKKQVTTVDPYNDIPNSTDRGFLDVYKSLGCVPQFDQVNENMTGRRLLRMFARISGTYYRNDEIQVKESDAKYINDYGEARINRFLDDVGIEKDDADRNVDTYSGGMKRKISLACTLITCPPILFLDESSCGVDIVAQRKLWQKILQKDPNQTIVMTTHSMLEADALCERIGIMVNGSLRCLGSTMQIKDQYGEGHQLELLIQSGYSGIQTPQSQEESSEDGSSNTNTNSQSQVKQTQKLPQPRGPPPKDFLDAQQLRRQAIEIERSLNSQKYCNNITGRVNDGYVDHSMLTCGQIAVEGMRQVNGFIPTTEGAASSNMAPPDLAQQQQMIQQQQKSPRAFILLECIAFSHNRAKMVWTVSRKSDLPKVFRWCLDDPLQIVGDYQLGEPTLEQVFLRFARMQEESKREIYLNEAE